MAPINRQLSDLILSQDNLEIIWFSTVAEYIELTESEQHLVLKDQHCWIFDTSVQRRL